MEDDQSQTLERQVEEVITTRRELACDHVGAYINQLAILEHPEFPSLLEIGVYIKTLNGRFHLVGRPDNEWFRYLLLNMTARFRGERQVATEPGDLIDVCATLNANVTILHYLPDIPPHVIFSRLEQFIADRIKEVEEALASLRRQEDMKPVSSWYFLQLFQDTMVALEGARSLLGRSSKARKTARKVKEGFEELCSEITRAVEQAEADAEMERGCVSCCPCTTM